jgi:hypothetical protein
MEGSCKLYKEWCLLTKCFQGEYQDISKKIRKAFMIHNLFNLKYIHMPCDTIFWHNLRPQILFGEMDICVPLLISLKYNPIFVGFAKD